MKKCEAIKCFQFQGLVIANSHGKLIGNKDSKESFNDETDCQTEFKIKIVWLNKVGKEKGKIGCLQLK